MLCATDSLFWLTGGFKNLLSIYLSASLAPPFHSLPLLPGDTAVIVILFRSLRFFVLFCFLTRLFLSAHVYVCVPVLFARVCSVIFCSGKNTAYSLWSPLSAVFCLFMIINCIIIYLRERAVSGQWATSQRVLRRRCESWRLRNRALLCR